VNAPITRVFGFVVVLFALLLVWTTRWTVFDAQSLRDNPLNARTVIDEEKINRGAILAADGTVLARSVKGPDRTFSRRYPTGSLFSQTVGYAFVKAGQAAGLELSDGQYLRGVNTGISAIIGQLGGAPQVGDNVYTTLDPKTQRLALQQLAGRAGSVVALDLRTGAIKAMVSLPTYDDNHPNAPCKLPGCSQFNAAAQGNDVPGSTFKVVTAVAAIDSGKFTPDSVVDGKSPLLVSGFPLANDGNTSWGPQTLTTALTYSINTIFAQVAQQAGRATMTTYMKRFGFYSRPPLDLPPGELFASQPYSSPNHAFAPASPNEDIGRIGIGQGGLLVTPLQMAMVAAAVGNGGKLMVPHLTDHIVNPDGQTILTVKPAVYSQVMKPSTAQAVGLMMRKVVEEGTGTAANLGNVSIAGKTGTASIGSNASNLTEPWFIGFAPAANPQYAIAVTINQTQGQFGGTVAAPIASTVLNSLLSGHG
jgi:peptidoglycan glycosyltransferase